MQGTNALHQIQTIKSEQRRLANDLREAVAIAYDETRDALHQIPTAEKDDLLALFLCREAGAPGLTASIYEDSTKLGF